MSQHSKFILTPISTILDDAMASISCLSPSIDSTMMCEYFMQSVFLKMTGFQEQKMKCICWELATVNYEYRYERFHQDPLGECSNYQEKCAVYHDIITIIKQAGHLKDYKEFLKKQQFKNIIETEIGKVHSVLMQLGWLERDYENYREFINRKDCCFIDQNTAKFFCCCENCEMKPKKQKKEAKTVPKCLKRSINESYRKVIYNHRNRCAHNTLSYQVDSPLLDKLASQSANEENYYVRFALLIGIDTVVRYAYEFWENNCILTV